MAGDELETPDPDVGDPLYEHMWELWVGPAVEERGLDVTPETLDKVVVELPPGGPVAVRFGDDAAIEARFTATRAIKAGEDVYGEDIAELHVAKPMQVDDNSGWICFFRLPDGRTWIAFDFIYNRARARTLLDRSAHFLGTAREKAATSLAVCLDNAYSAAELAVQAEMLLLQQATNNHKVRGKWLSGWSENGNSPQEHASTLWRLADLRKQARYGTEPIELKPAQLGRLLDVAEEMLERARARVELTLQAPEAKP